MVRTVLLALALALGGGAPYLGGLVDLIDSIWAESHYDPNGAGAHADPNGIGSESDAGGMADPNG
jgi:hypothetical protein